MKIDMKKGAMLLSLSVVLAMSASANAATAFQNPTSAAWGGWDRGDANTSFAGWSVIESTLDVTPDVGNNNTTLARLAANNMGAFITGGGLGGNVYSASDAANFSVVVQPNYTASTAPVTVAMQINSMGTALDMSTVKLGGIDWTSTATLFSGTVVGGFGGAITESLFVWENVSSALAYSLSFMATGAHFSLDELYVDIGPMATAPPSEVPVPAAAFLFAPALLGFMGLRRKAKTAA